MTQFIDIKLPEVEFDIADGMFIKQMWLKEKGQIVPQHSHKYAHTSLLATGSIRIWKDDVLFGDIKAPMPIHIVEGVKHTFMSLENNTVVYCIHRVDRTGNMEFEEEVHEISEAVKQDIINQKGE